MPLAPHRHSAKRRYQLSQGSQHVEVGVESMLQAVRVHIPSDQDAGPIVAHIGAEHVDHVTTRTSSSEEAYLALIGRQQ